MKFLERFVRVEPVDVARRRVQGEYKETGDRLAVLTVRLKQLRREGAFEEDIPEPLEEEHELVQSRHDQLVIWAMTNKLPRMVDVVVFGKPRLTFEMPFRSSWSERT